MKFPLHASCDRHGVIQLQPAELSSHWRRGTATFVAAPGSVTDAGFLERRAAAEADLAAPLPRVVDEVLFGALHDTEQYANNRFETDHGRLKARLRPMRGLKRDRTASVVIRGHAFIQNLQRGHYQLGVNALNQHLRVAAAFDELAEAI